MSWLSQFILFCVKCIFLLNFEMATIGSLEVNWFETAILFDPELIKRHNVTVSQMDRFAALMGFEIGNGAKLDKINLLKEQMSSGLAELAGDSAAPPANSKTMKKLKKMLKLQKAKAKESRKREARRASEISPGVDVAEGSSLPSAGEASLLARLAEVEAENRKLKKARFAAPIDLSGTDLITTVDDPNHGFSLSSVIAGRDASAKVRMGVQDLATFYEDKGTVPWGEGRLFQTGLIKVLTVSQGDLLMA